MNIYAYCGNNPINYIDPWGLEGKEDGQDETMMAGAGEKLPLNFIKDLLERELFRDWYHNKYKNEMGMRGDENTPYKKLKKLWDEWRKGGGGKGGGGKPKGTGMSQHRQARKNKQNNLKRNAAIGAGAGIGYGVWKIAQRTAFTAGRWPVGLLS